MAEWIKRLFPKQVYAGSSPAGGVKVTKVREKVGNNEQRLKYYVINRVRRICQVA